MGDDDHGHAGVLGQIAHDVQYAAHKLGVKGTCGLVEEQHVGVHGHGAGNGHALLLAARELAGLEVGTIGQTNGRKLLHGLGGRLFLTLLEHLDLADHHVLFGREVREEIELLKYHTHVAAQLVDVRGRLARDLVVFDKNVAGRGGLEQVHAAQHGRFARARRAQDHDDLAGPHVEVDVAQDERLAKALVKVLDTHNGVLALDKVVVREALVGREGGSGGLVCGQRCRRIDRRVVEMQHLSRH